MTESESSNTYIAGYEHSFFPSRPGLCVLGMLEASQVPWVDVRTCMGSWTPRSLSALTNTDGLVLPSTTGTVSALRKSAISSLISPAHALRYRRFAHPLAGTDARLAAKVARYTFLSAGLAPAVHARVSLAHPRSAPPGAGIPLPAVRHSSIRPAGRPEAWECRLETSRQSTHPRDPHPLLFRIKAAQLLHTELLCEDSGILNAPRAQGLRCKSNIESAQSPIPAL